MTCLISWVVDAYPTAPYRPTQLGLNLIFCLISVSVFILLCSRKFKLRQLIWLGSFYQVISTFFFSMWDHLEPFPLDYNPRLFLPISFFWMMAFPLIFPTTIKRVMIAGALSASMTFLTLAIAVFVLHRTIPKYMYFHFIFSANLGFMLSSFLFRQFNKVQVELARQRQMGSYRLKEKLGEGGMGEVWIASHAMLRRSAVIKLIHPKIMATPEEKRFNIKRFEREAQSIASLYSPNTIEIYDFGHMEDGTFFYVMEHLHGIDLDRCVHQFGALSQERTVFLLRQICSSLEEAHQQGMIHRDIKPGNVFVCLYGNRFDFIKVLDFGIVKDFNEEALERERANGNETLERIDSLSTRPGSLCGTPLYMAPEMILGKNVSKAYDIYALGCLAYFMLRGQALFYGKSVMEILSDHISTKPIPLSQFGIWIDPEFEALILQCLDKDPDRRPASMNEISKRLSALNFANPWSEEKAEKWWNTQDVLQSSKTQVSLDATTQRPTALFVNKASDQVH